MLRKIQEVSAGEPLPVDEEEMRREQAILKQRETAGPTVPVIEERFAQPVKTGSFLLFRFPLVPFSILDLESSLCILFLCFLNWSNAAVEQVQPVGAREGQPVIQREGEVVSSERREVEPIVREVIRPKTGWLKDCRIERCRERVDFLTCAFLLLLRSLWLCIR